MLINAGNPEFDHSPRVAWRDLLPGNLDLAGRRPDGPVQYLDQGRFSCAVGPDKRADLARPHLD